MMKALSIVTPTLNCGATFEATLLALAPMIREGAEHIVVDSGSDDGTVQMAEESGATVLTYPKGNMYAAINVGIQASRGDFLTYINGDDIIYADAIAEMMSLARDDVDFVYGNIDYIDEAGRFLFYWRSPISSLLPCATRCYGGLYQQGTIFRRSVLDRLAGFDSDKYKYCADTDFFLRAISMEMKFQKYSRKSVGAFRLSPGQFSQSRAGEMAVEGRLIRDRFWEGKSGLNRSLARIIAFAVRNSINVDSRLIRSIRGRGLDRR